MKTQTDLLREFLMARPRRWCAMPRLAEEIGAYAVHSRVADLRAEGLVVVNKIRCHRGRRWSFYRYLPVAICDACGQKTTYPVRIILCAPVAGAAICQNCLAEN